MKLLDLLLTTTLAAASIATAKPVVTIKRAVDTEYPFTLTDGTELKWKVGGVSGTGSSYNDGDVQDLMTALGGQLASVPSGSYFTVSSSVPGSNGGTLSGQFESDLYTNVGYYSQGLWQEIFDEAVDVAIAEDYPNALAITLLDGSYDHGVMTLKFVA